MHHAGEQLGFEFLCEETLAADFGQGLIQNFVALRGDDFFLADETGVGGLQRGDDPLGLPAGEAEGRVAKISFIVISDQ